MRSRRAAARPLPVCGLFLLTLLAPGTAAAAAAGGEDGGAAAIRVDCGTVIGRVRPLHGGNCGPVSAGGLVDVSDAFRALEIPLTRLHDCHWPDPNVVDVHAVFPDPKADPADPASYDFGRTDAYVRSVLATGSRVVYRLGESIEHTPVKYRVHPPADVERWAAACCGIVRHYNEGWADGFRHGIEYWEIWNEPENRPAMWTGSDEEYFGLYAAAARRIKGEFPKLKVGGPSLGHTGKLVDGTFKPSAFVLEFLGRCRDDKLPLDFFSWHLYADDPAEAGVRARALRALLDAHGFRETELHLNEWNYLPDGDWSPLAPAGQGPARERFYERMAGPAAGAFVAATLVNLQDAPVDAANYFRADAGDFGLFSAHGTPRKPFYAFKAFRMLLDTPRRVAVEGIVDRSRLVACAGINDDGTVVQILASNYNSPSKRVRLTFADLPWKGPTRCEVFVLDASRDLTPAQDETDMMGEPGKPIVVEVGLTAPTVSVVRLSKR